jgi:hypothetical protein
MDFDSLDQFAAARPGSFGKGPAAMVVAEDRVEVGATLDHVRSLGFRHVFVLAPPDLRVPPAPDGSKVEQHVIRARSRAPGATQQAVNTLIDKMPGE